jgi:type I restriction enzyme R subunit
VKIAFTGTPLIKSMKTNNEFGSYIDTYTIEQAVADGATVQILYEGREVKLKVTGDSLDSLFDEYFSDKTEEERLEIRKKHGTQLAILEAPQRIRRVCIDLLKHYNEHIYPNGFKAMIVTSSRNAAITYKEILDELGAPESAVIISGDHNDPPRFRDYTDPTTHKTQIEDFKKPFSTDKDQKNIAFLIVKDMLLTGFDAPIAQAMYLDRKLTDHTLLQAIARVNRTAKGKTRGFIVDYYGLSDYLTEALEMFTKDDVQGALRKLEEEIPHLEAAHARVMKHFKGMDIEDVEECVLSLEPKQRRQDFLTDFQLFSKQLDIVLPDSAAKPFLHDMKMLGKIANAAKNRYRDEMINIAGAGEKVRKLIEDHLHSVGIDPKIPPIDLLAHDFKEKLSKHKSARSRASEIENALRHQIRIKIDENPEFYKSLSEKLEDLIRKYRERWDELEQLLLDLRTSVDEQEQRPPIDGITREQYPYYLILEAEISSAVSYKKNIPSQEELVRLTKDLTAMIDTATAIIDFREKWNLQRQVQRDIIMAVHSQPYGSDELAKVIADRFLELALVKIK